MAAEPAAQTAFQLPNGAVTRADIGRLAREVETIDNFLRAGEIRQPGTPTQLPKTSKLFEEVVSINRLNMLNEPDRQTLTRFLQKIRVEAPVLHISFSSDPSPIFQQRLITWIRQQMHPQMVLQIGLQPSIGAGCVVRSTNKYFDFSLRQRFKDQRPLLISKLHGTEQTVAVAQPETAS